MTIPLGPFQVQIAVSWSRRRRRCWEVLASAGMTDHELARLNVHNTSQREAAHVNWQRDIVCGRLNCP